MMEVIEDRGSYLASFAALARELTSREPAWLLPIRKAAIQRFGELGFPTTRDEEWRFTNVDPIRRTAFKLSTRQEMHGSLRSRLKADQLKRALLGSLECTRLVFVNGHYSRELSSSRPLPAGVTAGSLGGALGAAPAILETHLTRLLKHRDRAFAALNTAFFEDGAFIHVPDGVAVEEPIHLVFLSSAQVEPLVSHPRTLIVAGRSSKATIIETYAAMGSGVYFTNTATEIAAGEEAVVDHTKIQDESLQAFHVATLAARLERGSHFTSHSVSLGGAILRNEIDAVLDGEGVDCVLDGLYMAGGQQLMDNHTRIEHARPHSQSREVYKGILDGSSRAVFSGKIFVRQDAQKTDAKQSNKNLLLSADAVVNTKPQLEIYADDVKCTHGATVGQLDDDALFYIRSRGLDLVSARGLLTYAFANEIIGRIQAEPVRALLHDALFARLPQALSKLPLHPGEAP
jgi:Fe-S cluster assembly protein SufD